MSAILIYSLKTACVFIMLLTYIFIVEHFTYMHDKYFIRDAAYMQRKVINIIVAISVVPYIRDLAVVISAVSVLIGSIDYLFQNRIGTMKLQAAFYTLIIKWGNFTYETNNRK